MQIYINRAVDKNRKNIKNWQQKKLHNLQMSFYASAVRQSFERKR